MIGDINQACLSGTIHDEIKVVEKNGKRYGKFTLINTFKLSEKSQDVSGFFQVFCMLDHHVDMCASFLKTGDKILLLGFISQKKDDKSGKTFVSFMPNHIVKMSGGDMPATSKMSDEDLPF